MKQLLLYLGHPGQFHLFKYCLRNLKAKNHHFEILIKKKDVLEDLLKNEDWKYTNILPTGRGDTQFAMAWGLVVRGIKMFKIARGRRPNLMAGTSTEITYVGKLLGIPSLVVNEDDAEAVPLFSNLSYPLADAILAPFSCNVGKWSHKKISYQGYHELAYLHPNRFSPRKEAITGLNRDGRYFILRFANLNAHHDKGKTGITKQISEIIIEKLKPHGAVYITSERKLDPQFERYRIKISPNDVHHALYYADLFVGDSQTMTAEAAVLGTPAVRFNDFVGRLRYLEELEHKYQLTYGIKTQYPEELYQKLDELLSIPNLKEEWQNRRKKMLSEKIDVTAFITWLIENYPSSVDVIKRNPDHQYNFM